MTLPYGGTPYGLGQQHIDDAPKHGIDLLLLMEHKWGAFLGRIIYEDCRTSIRRPMQLLSVFEEAGAKADVDSRFLSWTTPIINFPVVQHYTEGVVKKTWVRYGPPQGKVGDHDKADLQLSVCFIEDKIPSKGKQAQGASPNIIHSLDATHVALVVNACKFPVTTIHDSFGALLPDMQTLYETAREQFAVLHRSQPLNTIAKEVDADLSKVDFGNFNIEEVLNAEFCFI